MVLAAIAQISVLVVKDDPSMSSLVARRLMRAGFVVHEAQRADDAIRGRRRPRLMS